MRKFTFLQILVFGVLVFFTTNATATILITENFDYTVAQPLATNNSWKSFLLQTGTEKSTAVSDIAIADATLEYPGYLSTKVGKSIQIDGLNKDVYKLFPHIPGTTTEAYSAGSPVGGRMATADSSVYASMLVNIEQAPDGDVKGDCFFGFGSNNWGIGIQGRIYTKKSGNGFVFGVTRNGNAKTVWDATERSLNTTYLVVIKYTLISGDKNDRVYMSINPTLGSTEPTWIQNDVTDVNVELGNLVGAVQFLQQINTSYVTTKSKIKVGGLRVATTWAEVGELNNETGIDKLHSANIKVISQKGILKVVGANGQLVEVYNAVGKKIASKQVSDGETEIAVSTKGLVIVKVGLDVKKVVL
ncbi:MAG: DUF6383 domain-containing protein [Bacteroidales bacterium]|nr:DUF6383 domain-containing protein [Bacteroidales bacterium]